MILNQKELYEIMLREEDPINRYQYMEEFERFDKFLSGLKPSWNKNAFWFSGLWLLNRKMYRYFFIWLSIIGLSSLVSSILDRTCSYSCRDISLNLLGSTWLILAILLGVFGSSIYHQHIKQKIEQAIKQFPDEEQILACLHEEATFLSRSIVK